LREEDFMNVEIKTLPQIRVASLRHIGPYAEIGESFGRLGEIAFKANMFTDPAMKMVALYHDDPQATAPDKLRSDAGLIISEQASVPPELTEHRIPAGEYACAVHKGPYDTLPEAWNELMEKWLPSSGRTAANAPSCEVYLNNPMQTASADLLTELRIPLS
jgi:DNA gyrase inhibitor GyrI